MEFLLIVASIVLSIFILTYFFRACVDIRESRLQLEGLRADLKESIESVLKSPQGAGAEIKIDKYDNWTCPKCGNRNDKKFTRCWRCQYEYNGNSGQPKPEAQGEPIPAGAPSDDPKRSYPGYEEFGEMTEDEWNAARIYGKSLLKAQRLKELNQAIMPRPDGPRSSS